MRTVELAPQWYTAECDVEYDLDEDGEKKKDDNGDYIVLKESTVSYQLKPLTNQLASDIAGNVPFKRRGNKLDADGGYISTMQVRATLTEVKGLKDRRTAKPDDPENEDLMQDLKLVFIKEKIGLKKIDLITLKSMNLLPPELYAEILFKVKGMSGDVEDEEAEEGEAEDSDVDFTPSSLTPTTSNAET